MKLGVLSQLGSDAVDKSTHTQRIRHWLVGGCVAFVTGVTRFQDQLVRYFSLSCAGVIPPFTGRRVNPRTKVTEVRPTAIASAPRACAQNGGGGI